MRSGLGRILHRDSDVVEKIVEIEPLLPFEIGNHRDDLNTIDLHWNMGIEPLDDPVTELTPFTLEIRIEIRDQCWIEGKPVPEEVFIDQDV